MTWSDDGLILERGPTPCSQSMFCYIFKSIEKMLPDQWNNESNINKLVLIDDTRYIPLLLVESNRLYRLMVQNSFLCIDMKINFSFFCRESRLW